jgi:hypothetical protein
VSTLWRNVCLPGALSRKTRVCSQNVSIIRFVVFPEQSIQTVESLKSIPAPKNETVANNRLRTPDFDKDLKQTESSLDGTVAAPEQAASIGGSITATGGSSDGAFDECVVQTKVRHFATRIQEIFPEEHDSPLWAPFKIGLKLAIQAPLAIFQRAR